jgi:predicted nucleic acid-binding protein
MAGFDVIPKEKYINYLDEYDVVRDKHDRHVLACADITKCNAIVSGDSDLLALRKFKHIQILKSTEFIKLVE